MAPLSQFLVEVVEEDVREQRRERPALGRALARWLKLLIFTEHKDTLDFLVGDGHDGRPLGKLVEWNLAVTQIHGGMKVGDRDTPGTRQFNHITYADPADLKTKLLNRIRATIV